MPIQREFKIIKQNFVNSVNSARGKKSLVESIVLREFDESFGWKYGEVVLTPGFNKFTLSEVIEEAECWRKNENQIQNSYNFIEPAVKVSSRAYGIAKIMLPLSTQQSLPIISKILILLIEQSKKK